MNTQHHNNKHYNSIETMERLMDQIEDFEKLVNKYEDLDDPRLHQEYRLFNQYIQWRIEDINSDTKQLLSSMV